MKIKIKITAALIVVLPMFLTEGDAVAQGGYPDRAVRMVVGYPPAGPVDIIARIMSDKLTEIWGQPVVVENVSGAGGNIAGDRVAKATPDGYTLLVATNAQLAVNPSLYSKMSYDPAKDLMPISQAVYSPNILVIPNDVPAGNVQELIAYLRAHTGEKLTFASERRNIWPANCSRPWRTLTSSTCLIAEPRPSSRTYWEDASPCTLAPSHL